MLLTFNKNNPPNKIYPLYCDIHKITYLSHHTRLCCPICSKEKILEIKKQKEILKEKRILKIENKNKLKEKKSLERLLIKQNKIKEKEYLKQEKILKIQLERKLISEKYTLNNEPLDLNNKDNLKSKYYRNPGVLFIYGLKNEVWHCLTGGQTVDLYGHIMMFQRRSDREFSTLVKKDNRWNEISSYESFKIIVTHENIIDFKEREILEMNEALEYKAIHWKPSITQMHLM